MSDDKTENLPQIIDAEAEVINPANRPVPWTSLMPRNFKEAMELATNLSNSTLVPSNFKGKPGEILIAIQWGAEIGLRPLQSLNSVVVINGRPGIFGDAALALVWASGLCLSYDDAIEGQSDNYQTWVGVSRSWRRGTPEPIERRFSYIDAKQAQLWGKPGPWQEYTRRMLCLRSRGFLLRDLYPDVLHGTFTVEELQDYPTQLKVAPYPVDQLEERFNRGGSWSLHQTDAKNTIDFPRSSPKTPGGGNVVRPAPLKI